MQKETDVAKTLVREMKKKSKEIKWKKITGRQENESGNRPQVLS